MSEVKFEVKLEHRSFQHVETPQYVLNYFVLKIVTGAVPVVQLVLPVLTGADNGDGASCGRAYSLHSHKMLVEHCCHMQMKAQFLWKLSFQL